MNVLSKRQYKEASDETLDALYSAHCLRIAVYNKNGKWVDSNGDTIPKYCSSYSREYIIKKVKKALSNDNR